MFRTRDFVLFFTIIVFLVAAIGLTVLRQQATTSQINVIVPSTSDEINSVATETIEGNSNELSREDRLRSLREKIKASELLTISEMVPEPDVEEEVVIELDTDTVPTTAPLLCAGYVPISPAGWSTALIKSEAVEGLRQYFIPNPAQETASGTMVATRQVLLSLPQSQIPFGSPQCIPHDVVGVALDGSLIRNNEASLYRVFGSETLVGYALDGFPIYGLGTSGSDGCGGKVVSGQYRYELSAERETILNCFANRPAQFAS